MERIYNNGPSPVPQSCCVICWWMSVGLGYNLYRPGPGSRQTAGENTVKMRFGRAVITAGVLVSAAAADAANFEVTKRADIVFVEHDGTKLLGDLYLPKGLDKAPVLVAVHGGGWQVGSRKFYANWGAYLAKNGIAMFAIEYRLMKPGVNTYPGAVYDTKAAIQFVRGKAADLSSIPNASA